MGTIAQKGIYLASYIRSFSPLIHRPKQISNWFNNRGSGSNRRPSGSGSAPIVIGGSQSSQRALSKINLYSKKYYDIHVRDRADAAWKVAKQNPEHPSRISIINQTLAECWEDEDEDIKAEIQKDYEIQKAQQPTKSILASPTPESYAA